MSKYEKLSELKDLSSSSSSLLPKHETSEIKDEDAILEKVSVGVEETDESTLMKKSKCNESLTKLKSLTSNSCSSKNSEETPLPKTKVISLMLCLLSGSFVATMIFSFVGFMVEDFNIAETKQDIGFYAGYIASAYFLGQFISGWFWGYIADIKGRRPVLIIGIAANLISTLIFGFSINLPMAIISRGLGGLGNANFAIAKSYMNDITDSTNKPRGFSQVAMSWSLGSIVGPVIGGYCSKMSSRYSILENTIFETFPYALPCIIGAIINLISLIFAIKFLQESLHYQPVSLELEEQNTKANKKEETKETPKGNPSETQISEPTITQMEVVEEPPKEKFVKKYKSVILAIVLYMIIAVIYVIWDEILPLWLLTDINAGGLGFSPDQIGTVLMISGFYLIFFQTFIYHRLANKLGALNCLRLACLFAIIGFFFLPFLNSLVSNASLLWTLLVILLLIRSTGGTMHFTSVNLLVNITAPEHAGKANGIAFTLSGLVRTFGPFSGASLFSWSVSSNSSYPLNQHFIFLVMSVFTIILLIVSFALPKIPSTKKI